MAIALGVLASLLIGVSDALGRSVTRRSNAFSHLVVAMGIGIIVAVLATALVPSQAVGSDLIAGGASGVAIALALAINYEGMARSSAAIVSPIAAVFAALLPLAWDITTGLRPSGLALVGCVIAIIALVLTTYNPEVVQGIRTGIVFGISSGLVFGLGVTLAANTSLDSGAWPVAAQRVCGLAAVFLVGRVSRHPPMPPRSLLWLAGASGAVGTVGIVALVSGAQRGDPGTVAVAGSMFPVVVALLSWRFDGDHLRKSQFVGVAGAILGTALIAVGSS